MLEKHPLYEEGLREGLIQGLMISNANFSALQITTWILFWLYSKHLDMGQIHLGIYSRATPQHLPWFATVQKQLLLCRLRSWEKLVLRKKSEKDLLWGILRNHHFYLLSLIPIVWWYVRQRTSKKYNNCAQHRQGGICAVHYWILYFD